MDVVGFSKSEQFDLFRIIASILHIGNIDITSDRTDQAHMRVPAQAEKVCHLLGIPVQEFTKAVLRPRVLAGREWVTQARTKQQALDELSALCKTLYEKSFGALVDRINRALDRPSSKSTFIGVLDIAGFEIFEVSTTAMLFPYPPLTLLRRMDSSSFASITRTKNFSSSSIITCLSWSKKNIDESA